MAYWMAYRNTKGKYKNYMCSECHKAAPQNEDKISIVTDKCPCCGREMSYVGILDEAPVIKK